MGTRKKEATRKERQGQTGDGMSNVKVKGENFYRTAKKIKTLNMFKDGKPQRNARGDITKAASYQSREVAPARVEPNRKWWTNSRVISQQHLSAFRDAVAAQTADPNSYLLKQNKLPMSLIRDGQSKNGLKQHEAKIAVQTAPFSDTFGPNQRRKRVKLGVSSLEDLAGESVKMHEDYLERVEQNKLLSGQLGESGEAPMTDDGSFSIAQDPLFSKGQSKRIWNELYKVIDSSDVILHVLDARDPLGTRCRSVEKYIKEEAPHKHLVFILNKCDLVPTRVAAAWVRSLSTEYPTLAFHASVNNSFGKGSLISLLRQFSALHSDRKQISVGTLGYPNCGKSSIINTLRSKRVCTVAPIAGETKVWQYITLMKRIYLIDCPGVVPPNQAQTDTEKTLLGVVRIENVDHPAQYIPALLERVQRRHLERTYDLRGWEDATELLEMSAKKSGKLLKGGEPDVEQVARMLLNDFLRGKIPWFTPPPFTEGWEVKGVEGKKGALGEMGRKRKRQDTDLAGDGDADGNHSHSETADQDTIVGSEDDGSFEGFGDEGTSGDEGGSDAETDESLQET